MRKFKVLDEYFDLLFRADAVAGDNINANINHGSEKHRFKQMVFEGAATDEAGKLREDARSKFLQSKMKVEALGGLGSPSDSDVLSFVEFMRVNMRLAEDRILSFVTVFTTGYGTKWTQVRVLQGL
jgi:Zn-dependent alcohol dehydrogenase